MVGYDSTYADALGRVPVDGPCELASVLALTDCEPLFERLRQYNHTGRPPYCVRAMWRAVLTKYLLGLRYNVELVALLRSNASVRDACGFGDTTPNESVLCRFFKRLASHQDLLHDAMHHLIDRLAEAINEHKTERQPAAGRMMAIDSTDIESFCDVSRKPYTDPDAAWGHRTPKHATNRAESQGEKDEFFFGFKMHTICDGYWGFPIGHVILPANRNDSPTLPVVMKQVLEHHPDLKPAFLMADRGYDATSNYTYLEDEKVLPVILMRDTDKDGLYTVKWRPKCLGGKAMDYIETDQRKGHLFRCPQGGCRLKDKVKFTRHCDSQHYENPVGNSELLRKVGRLSRASRVWKKLYRRRTTIERLFSSMKASRLLNLHRYRGGRKVRLHAGLSNLTYLATMLMKVLGGQIENLRWMRLSMPAG